MRHLRHHLRWCEVCNARPATASTYCGLYQCGQCQDDADDRNHRLGRANMLYGREYPDYDE